jgi:mono/diheme cytochrome c family protein
MRLSPRFSLVVAAGLAAWLGACQLDKDQKPARPVIHFSLSAATQALGEDGLPVVPADVQTNIAGSLAMLFGTPENPQFQLLPEWKDEGFNPNWPAYPVGEDGSGEVDLASLAADNKVYWRRQLAAIEAGQWGRVFVQDFTPDLREKWNELCAQTPEEARGADFKAAAAELFTGYYPRLSASAELYRQHCLHCHGPEGGGDGPTAPFLNPRPRDYRHGTFKFTAVGKSAPRRVDLYRILDEGVTGTSMPSFRRFSQAQLHGLVDYVRLLSMRGMVERSLVSTFGEEEMLTSADVADAYLTVWEKWKKADEKALVFEGEVPPPTPESIARGRELFMDAKAGNCFSCHGPEGRGDGTSAFALDPETGKLKSTYKDDWGHEILPRNLRLGIFRGGRRPIDLYRRIKNGIAGGPMPEAASTLTSDDIWHLVHYVGSISERPQHAHLAASLGEAESHGEAPASGDGHGTEKH